jgi:ATP-dependent DNA helicase RecQ
MEFLARALDDPHAGKCGKCAGCKRQPLLSPEYDQDLANKAAIFLRRSYQPLQPRKQWPTGNALPIYAFSGRIGNALCAQEGRALCLWRDAGWGQLVAEGKYEQGRFDDKLVEALRDMICHWNPYPAPEWVTCIPSLNRPELVPDFARRLAGDLGLPFHACIQKAKANPPQKEMQNSFQQAHNLDGVFAVDPGTVSAGTCLLIDDMTDSGWTFTVAAAILRRAGCTAVFPLALALNSPRMD